MIQTLPCPKCKELFLLANEVSSQARLECPGCQEQFVVAELLDGRLPTWKIVGGAVPVASSDNLTLEESSTEDELELADSGDDSSPGGSEKSKGNWEKFEPITHEQYESMKLKNRSPLWSVLQVVLGGAAAVPIALLILWHLLDKDIAGAGPLVGQYVPWIVPAKYRPQTVEENPMPAEGERQRGGFRNFDEELSMAEGGDSEADANPPDATLGLDPDHMQSNSGELAMAPELPMVQAEKGAGGDSAAAMGDGAQEQQLQDDEPNRDIFALIRNCDKGLDQWNASVLQEGIDLKPLAQSIYQDLRDLAAAIDELPETNPAVRAIRDAVQPISRKIKRRQDVQGVIDQGARHWVKKEAPAADSTGALKITNPLYLAVVVEISEAREGDASWSVSVTDESNFVGQPLEITIPRQMAPALIPGQRLLLLGKLAADEPGAPDVSEFAACYLHAL